MRRIENIGFGGMKLIQDTDNFRYGLDAVILADFACSISKEFECAVDLGTGTGVIPFIMSHKNEYADFVGIEIQKELLKLAEESCRLNGLEERISFMNIDVAEIDDLSIGDIRPDVVTCNPPYFIRGGGIPAKNPGRFISRHETSAVLDDFVKAASLLLGGKGDFFMVHRPSRLVDIFCSCRQNGLEPKDIRFVMPRAGEVPNIALIHCTAGGGRELSIMKELCVYESDGRYTDEIMRIYERK